MVRLLAFLGLAILLHAAPAQAQVRDGRDIFERLSGRTFVATARWFSDTRSITFKIMPDGQFSVKETVKMIGQTQISDIIYRRGPDGNLNQLMFVVNNKVYPVNSARGTHGYWTGNPAKWSANYYLDDAGNLHILTRNKGKLEYYAKLADQNSVSGEVTVAKPSRSEVLASYLGASLSEIDARVGLSLGTRIVTASTPVLPAPAEPALLARPAPGPTASLASAPATDAGGRIALIVGNSGYDARFGSLPNPARDANAVGAALRSAGFDVEIVQDADQKAMKRALTRFGQRLTAAGRQATGVFFYAGHGVQSAGTNYLVPIGAAIETEGDVDMESVAADSVLQQMERAGIATSIVILDACRNLPLPRTFRDSTRGLARMDAPNGSFVAYSTAPGAVAADGGASGSPFAAALVEEIAKPGQNIQSIFLNVRRAVFKATAGKQVPWESSSLLDTFVFTPAE